MNDLLDEPIIRDVPDVETDGSKPDAGTDWDGVLGAATITATELATMPISPREIILGKWFCVGDLGFMFAPRGVGKTWLAMMFALTIATGDKAGPWAAPKGRRVLYVDGEMALDLTQMRYRALCKVPCDNLMLIHHEIMFTRTGKVLNLTSPLVQEALFQHALKNKVEVMFLDNLSCLFSGVKENDADAWELVLPWLLQLRRHGIAVVIVAHAGRNGLMRGTSRREDAAAWILSLSESAETTTASTGARFVARFTKCRNAPGEDAPTLEWHFQRSGPDDVIVDWREADPLAVFRGWIEDGLETCGEIATEMQVSNGTVSKLAKRAEKAGWLTKEGRRYVLVASSDQAENS
jgi:putative DNA primase/helicase